MSISKDTTIELKKIFTFYNILFFVFFLLTVFYFLISCTSEYKEFLEEKNNFQKYEKMKVQYYLNGVQYGGYGFRVLFQISNLGILFDDNILETIESNIDTKETIKISNSLRGRLIFVFLNKIYLGGFSGLVFFFFSYFYLFLGLNTINNLKIIRFYKSIRIILGIVLKRALLMGLFSFLIFIFAFLVVKIIGINFSNSEIKVYTLFMLYITLILLFFYTLGLLISLFPIKKRKLNFTIAFLLWIIFVIYIPSLSSKYITKISNKIQSIEKLNIEKLKRAVEFEREARDVILKIPKENREKRLETSRRLLSDYLKSGHIVNVKKEFVLMKGMKKTISSLENQSVLFPTNYFYFISREISTKGFYCHIDFFNFVMNMRNDFLKYYFENEYYRNDSKIQSFVKNDENIFKAKSQLPKTFWKGFSITAIYTLLTFLATLFILFKRLKKIPTVDKSGIVSKKCRTTFVLRKNPDDRNKLFHSYEAQKNTLCIDRITLDDLDVGIKPADMLTHFSKMRGNDPKFARATLTVLGIDDIDKIKRKDLNQEIMKKIYIAAALVDEVDTIVVNDILKGESRAFEYEFINLMQLMEAKEKRILYLSSEPFETIQRKILMTDNVHDQDTFIKLDEVSLR